MKRQTSRLWLRLGATLIVACYGIVGAFAVHVSYQAPTADLAGRSFWIDVTFLIASLLAISVSWLVEDLSNIWCVPAKREK